MHSADILLGCFPFNCHQPRKKTRIDITSFYKGKKNDTERLINFFRITMNSNICSQSPCIMETMCPSYLHAP